MALVPGHNFESVRQGNGRYAHVGVAYGGSPLLQLNPHLAVSPGRGRVEGKNGKVG